MRWKRRTASLPGRARGHAHREKAITGGVASASCRPVSGQGAPTICPDCGAEVRPSRLHLFWGCPAYAQLRRAPEPLSSLALRLGWGPPELMTPGGFVAAQQRIAQMADIRELELQRAYRRKRAARWDAMASVRLDSSLAGALPRPLVLGAPRLGAAAGGTAALVRLGPASAFPDVLGLKL
eukprot:3001455-Alexandrium_andersonii.AAC.1